MSTVHPIIEDPQLGPLTRAETTLDDGDTVTHDWYAGSLGVGDHEVELMIDGSDPATIERLLPRARAVIAELDSIRRRATNAIITHFSDGEPTAGDLDEGAADLQLDAIETTTDETVLHFTDSCGEHFPDGYWPAVHIDTEGGVAEVTVES
ncbi:hypothetical protein [Microbacterium alcoholitolerans]|uniref:hypothetical protein n=1 Tax=unclassified Microbacterium TaxID=2609290 RepID=UPI003D1847C5